MTDKQKTLLVDFATGLMVTAVCIYLNRDQGYSMVHLLCDGFFAAAVLLLCWGGLVFCGNHGAFDMLGYGMKTLAGLFAPGAQLHNPDEDEDYFSYCQRKATERKPFGHLMIAGGVYLALAAVCVVIYLMGA